MAIPRTIHQIWLGPKQAPQADMASWREKHPPPGWTYKVWHEGNLPTLRHQALFDAFHGVYHGQSDILRYEILYQFGGIYADADSTCLRTLDDAFIDVEEGAWASDSYSGKFLAGGFMGAEPGHPLYAAILDSLDRFDVDEVANEERQALYGGAWMFVGPGCLTRAVAQSKIPIRIFPGWHFFQQLHTGQEIEIPPGGIVYATHWWGSTKRLYRDA